ncbi:MAG TPA: 5-formyltetrahydrofolate cyclo-ligase [Eubacteriales bacterium]|nr:5-formyltetrahydrofolate cyclo-ligase [Eubacteriales bacterium]
MEKMDAKTARIMIWEELRKVARPDSRFSWDFAEFITDYEGSDRCAENLCKTEIYRSAKVLFITPDNNLERFREQAIRDQKTILMTNYGITRGVFLIGPGQVPAGKEELASTLDGVQRFWKHQTLKDVRENIGHIDMMVTGASAITPGGIRFGKGHGYFDLEWAFFYMSGVVDTETPVFAVGHDCQVVDVDVSAQPYDTAIDYIVTPTRVIRTRSEFPKPTRGIIWSMLAPGMREQIPPVQELWMERFCK